jgi:putative membrane protein
MNLESLNSKRLIIIVSLLIPVVVAILFFLPKDFEVGDGVYYLPAANAVINALTSVVLILAYVAIRRKDRKTHKKLMLTALGLSVLFLLSYVTYHSLTESTVFGGEGWIKSVYYFILISHILLAIAIVPLVLITFSRALAQKFDKHKKIARVTLPLWLYVTLSGVVVYLMISPYY